MKYKRALELIEDEIQNGLYTGAALGIIRNGKLDHVSYHGRVSDARTAAETSEQTLFDLASLTKIVSTTPICLRFLERGLLRLDDKVQQFFPSAIQPVADMNIRQLLTHSSGMPSHFLLQDYISEEKSIREILTEFALPRMAEQAVEYSCMGFILLGEILKEISGLTMAELFEQEVAKPLGLEAATFYPEGEVVATRGLRSREFHQGVVHDENARVQTGGGANAGLFANLHDLLTYAQNLINDGGELFTKRTLDLARVNYTAGTNEDRGLGFFLGSNRGSSFGDLCGDDAYGHTGFTGTSILIEPHSDSAVVFLTNRMISDPLRGNMVRHRALLHNTIFAE